MGHCGWQGDSTLVLSVSDKWFFIAKDHVSLKRYF